MKHLTPLLTLLLTLAPACAAPPDDDGDEGGQDGPAVTEEQADGTYETVLDATAEDAWTLFDFESRTSTTPANPDDDPVWDLGALRFNVKTNGGTSGSGGAAVAIVEGSNFDAVTAVPSVEFIEDSAKDPGVGGEMAETSPGYAFDNWFAYDMSTHTLAPVADRVYVIRTPEGNHYKIEMLDYYDDAGTPGFVRFRWAELAG